MICPECGSANVRHEIREEPYTYKGQTKSFLVEGEYCQECGEAVLSREESQRLNREMLAFNAAVNAGQFNPERIQNVRKKLGLDQKEAAAMFGGGVNAFSRYERGKIVPPQSLEVLFELVEKHRRLRNGSRSVRLMLPEEGPQAKGRKLKGAIPFDETMTA
ncbi:MAG: type II TA system antitoxin MqsA family protein [Bilophila sp.]